MVVAATALPTTDLANPGLDRGVFREHLTRGPVRASCPGLPWFARMWLADNVRAMHDSAVPRLRQVVLDTADARTSAEFWRQLLGLVYRPGHEPTGPGQDDPAGRDWLNLRSPDGTPCLAFQQVEELPRATWPQPGVPQQLHLDLTVRDIDELDAVDARVRALGGELRLDRSNDDDEPLRVYADPDGHPFCVFVAD